MNPFTLMTPLYRHFGAEYPIFSTISMFIFGGTLFVVLWWLTGKEYSREQAARAVKASAPMEAPATAQLDEDTPVKSYAQPKRREAVPSGVNQQSAGSNSPNILGNNNTVNYGVQTEQFTGETKVPSITQTGRNNIAQIGNNNSTTILEGEVGLIHSFRVEFTIDVPTKPLPRTADGYSIGGQCNAGLFYSEHGGYVLRAVDVNFQDWQFADDRHRYGFKLEPRNTEALAGQKVGRLNAINSFVFDCGPFLMDVGSGVVDWDGTEAEYSLTVFVNGIRVVKTNGKGQISSLKTQAVSDVSKAFADAESNYLAAINRGINPEL